MAVEVAGGMLSGSLALLADAGHMLTDAIALLFAWIAFRVGRAPADARRSYGYHRLQVIAALFNGLTLIGVVGWIVIEAARRIAAPGEVLGGPMLAVAAVGLVVNLAAFAILHGGDRENLNLKAAAAHVVGDILGSAAAIAAAAVILWSGWTPIDPILSLVVAGLILRSSWAIIRKSAHILLEGTPDWLDVGNLKAAIVGAVPGVVDIHHVHVWSLTSERPMITLHARVRDGTAVEPALAGIKRQLASVYGISHSTVQIERGPCADGASGDP
jgi:cobalt-zinc-cadmium efflux system protein